MNEVILDESNKRYIRIDCFLWTSLDSKTHFTTYALFLQMRGRRQILIAGSLILFGQLVIFKDYISPIQWGQIKVSGLACTCPDETVLNGQWYLRSITPDSLKRYDLDYSEIYVTERPTTRFDVMGVGDYIIKGHVIGKKRVSEIDPWNPIVKIDEWKEIGFIKYWSIRILLVGQVLILLTIIRRKTKGETPLGESTGHS